MALRRHVVRRAEWAAFMERINREHRGWRVPPRRLFLKRGQSGMEQPRQR